MKVLERRRISQLDFRPDLQSIGLCDACREQGNTFLKELEKEDNEKSKKKLIALGIHTHTHVHTIQRALKVGRKFGEEIRAGATPNQLHGRLAPHRRIWFDRRNNPILP